MISAPAARALLDALVREPSVSGTDNGPLLDLLTDHIAGPGVRFYRDAAADGRRANLLAWRGPRTVDGGPGLVLCGHLDVVPEGRGWASPPFVPTERDGRIYGRGTSDMKGFVALAAEAFRAAPEPAAPLVLLFTYDEEVGTVGARELVERWALPEGLPRNILVGEPTLLSPVTRHKGHLKMRLVVHGVSAHSAYPHLGRSAIVPAARAVLALAEVDAELAEEEWAEGAAFPEAPYPALNVGLVDGGTAINVVPEWCTVELGVRTLPGMDQAALEARIRAAVARTLGDTAYELTAEGDSPPLAAAADSRFLDTILDLTGAQRATSVAYATDAGWLQRRDHDCVVCGPGDIERAHKPDEYISLAELAAGAEFVGALVKAQCGP